MSYTYIIPLFYWNSIGGSQEKVSMGGQAKEPVYHRRDTRRIWEVV